MQHLGCIITPWPKDDCKVCVYHQVGVTQRKAQVKIISVQPSHGAAYLFTFMWFILVCPYGFCAHCTAASSEHIYLADWSKMAHDHCDIHRYNVDWSWHDGFKGILCRISPKNSLSIITYNPLSVCDGVFFCPLWPGARHQRDTAPKNCKSGEAKHQTRYNCSTTHILPAAWVDILGEAGAKTSCYISLLYIKLTAFGFQTLQPLMLQFRELSMHLTLTLMLNSFI